RDEVQGMADLSGDSLGLSIAASKADAKVIVFCGVHFMAESASILCPDKTILLPRMDAGCPMADMITAEGLIEKKIENPGVPVVTYVNSTAEVKAHSDICCTSANAVKVVNSLNNAKKVLMVPDKNLAQYVARSVDKEVIWWEGFCPTHHILRPEEVLRCKERYPHALFVCHPECTPEVVSLADHVCSTSGMYKFVKESRVREMIIGTERGILYRLKNENPEKRFYLPSRSLICPNMKLTTLENVLHVLETMENVVKVPEDIRLPAAKSLERMLSIPRD
ncbi:MAG: quinolinate synthase NadA, partial [Thermodesulfobacteriota bacterium]